MDCPFRAVVCPKCGTKLEIKGMAVEVVLDHSYKESGSCGGEGFHPPVERKRSGNQSGTGKPTDKQRGQIIKSWLKDTLLFDSVAMAKELGLKTQQVAAVVAWCHPNLGGRAYIRKYTEGL